MSDQYRNSAPPLLYRRWPWQASLRPGGRIGLVHAGNLGDIVHALPMAGAIKAACPSATIVFIGRRYTEPLIRASRYVDEFFDAELARHDADALAAQRLDILFNPYPSAGSRRPRRARACRRELATCAVATPCAGAIASPFMAVPDRAE